MIRKKNYEELNTYWAMASSGSVEAGGGGEGAGGDAGGSL